MAKDNRDSIVVREISPDDWPLIELLFGEKGACGGCWCMHWRTPKGGKMWEEAKGEPNKKSARRLIMGGKAAGIIALDKSEPVGWCSFGRRDEFPRLDRTKAYQYVSAPKIERNEIYSIVCFFVKASHRKLGLGKRMAKAAVDAIAKRSGQLVEAYPVTLTKAGNKLPPAFSFTGPETLFERLGFEEVQRLADSRPLYQLKLERHD
ncbi:MAG: GNAT family N-acetyltransferase [candidate division Zixibacteria bacterium]